MLRHTHQLLTGRHRGTDGSAAKADAARTNLDQMNVYGNALMTAKREANTAVVNRILRGD